MSTLLIVDDDAEIRSLLKRFFVQHGYLLPIELRDGSWLGFTAPRSWGLEPVPRAFNAMQARIQQLISDRTQMLAAISHDLRAPLTRMRLRGEFVNDRKQQGRLFRDIDEMQAMINAALAFFRDDTLKESPTHFDLGELLLTLVEDYTDQGLPVTCPDPGKRVHFGRPGALKRVLTNLIDNALQYAGEATLEQSQAEGRVILWVRDRGPGLPESELEKVMAPFYRLEASRNRATGGVGLGLATARAVIAEEGGELTLANRRGGGLSARITLPAA
ncbi:sensor histidine kinase [Alcanivorax sp. 521-1]|uniref:histidine kinase n=1 Tax=Alloalcanivorax profundimaris TaxID=2735259 RepID=A0ABS0ALC9_9GAMM|nr:ATP-binding protein [Alloalcanivorax profundimaris]MBF5054944.1 sensor histidine kinase [Alloalcanivorax profundimaris]